ncbi:MAG TPA: cupin domain-containing protein [Candidatus Binataceae bacterium]|nr:cupin domain-containing protein [Candidatus Binataceae bacterium]
MVTRRQMMKTLAVGSTMLGSALVPMLSAIAQEPSRQDLAHERFAQNDHGDQPSLMQGIKIANILEQKLPDGKVVNIVTVVFPPGVEETPHRHPGPVFGYVLEGALVTQVEPGKVVTYQKGDAWYEPPMHIHSVARSASKTRPAKILALLIHEKGQQLVMPA